MILLIDNYDSFSYNLYQFIGTIEPDIKVIRNDAYTIQEIKDMQVEAIIISPGPGKPEDAGICIDLIKEVGDHIPILGVCLGHQSICVAYGGVVSYAKKLMHGKQSIVKIDTNCPIYKGLDEEIKVARYHSLALLEETLPDVLEVTARSDDNEIMSIKHKEFNIYGVQFHPESIMTPDGMEILRNFITIAKGGNRND